MNIFSLLDNSDNEEEQQKVAQNKKKATENKDSKTSATGAAAAKPSSAAPAAKKDATSKPAAKPADSKPKGKENSNGSKQNEPKAAKDDKPKASSAAPAEEQSGKDNNRGGDARGKERHRRGEKHHGSNAENGEDSGRFKREFERRSATGRGREVSKGGRGKFGAGNVQQDAMEAEKDPNNAEVEVEQADKPEGEEVAAEEPAEPAEPEPVTFTLDEFMQKRSEAHAKAASLVSTKERKVNTASFAGLSAKEEDTTELIPGKSGKSAASHKDQRSTGKTVLTDVAFSFESNANGDRGYSRENRGGRGGGRGRGGQGRGDRQGGRSSPHRAPATVFNSGDFPSL